MSKKPTIWIVIDENGNAYGPFDGTMDASRFGFKKWPDSPVGREDWHIVALRSPDE